MLMLVVKEKFLVPVVMEEKVEERKMKKVMASMVKMDLVH